MAYELRRNRAQLSALHAQRPKLRGVTAVAALMMALGVLSVVWAVLEGRSDDSAERDANTQTTAVSRAGDVSWAEATISPFAAAAGPLPAAGRLVDVLADPRGASPDLAATAAIAPESALAEALASPQEDARRDGLQWALGTGLDVPQDTLQDLMANDSSDDVRQLALQGLTERPEATREEIRSILDAAVANPSAAVRADAARMIERMNELELMDEQAREFRRRAP